MAVTTRRTACAQVEAEKNFTSVAKTRRACVAFFLLSMYSHQGDGESPRLLRYPSCFRRIRSATIEARKDAMATDDLMIRVLPYASAPVITTLRARELSPGEWAEGGAIFDDSDEAAAIATASDVFVSMFADNDIDLREGDLNVSGWLREPSRTSYQTMAARVCEELRAVGRALTDVELVVVAHAVPDVHLGTSVSSCVISREGMRDAVGFAASGRGGATGVIAAAMAADMIATSGRKKVLVLAVDQDVLPYPTARQMPRKSAAGLLIEAADTSAVGRRIIAHAHASGGDLVAAASRACAQAGVSLRDVTLIGAADAAGTFGGAVRLDAGQSVAATYIALASCDIRTWYTLLVAVDDDGEFEFLLLR